MTIFQVSKLNETLIYNYIVLCITIINFTFLEVAYLKVTLILIVPSLVDVEMTRVPSALSTKRPVSSFTNVSMGSKNMECA